MSPPEPSVAGSRERLVSAATSLLARRGYAATGVKDLTREAAVPVGSFYFHFPGGKEELGVHAVVHGATGIGELLRSAMADAETPEEAVVACVARVADAVEADDWEEGCPVAATALEVIGSSVALRNAAAQAFETWTGIVRTRLQELGASSAMSDLLASATVSMIEGAELVARVRGDREPFDRAADALARLARPST